MALPFTVVFRPGTSLSDQIIFAVKKAVVSGLLQPGDRFPSVRTLSQDLRINPNTAHKATASLAAEGWLVVDPGVGTLVGQIPPGGAEERSELLGAEVEHLVVLAKTLQIPLSEVQEAIATHWKALT